MHLKLSDLGTFERPSNPVSPRVATQLGTGGQGGFWESAKVFFFLKRTVYRKRVSGLAVIFSWCIQLILVSLFLFANFYFSCCG